MPHNLRRTLHGIVLLVWCCSVALAQSEDDPFAPNDGGAKPPADAAWGGGDVVRIPLDSSSEVAFGPAGCSIVVVDAAVWDIKRNEQVGELEGVPDRSLRVVSGNGQWFAAASQSPNQTDTSVGVWSIEKGVKVLDIPGSAEAYVDLLQFSRDKYLLLGGRHNNEIAVWDVEKGQAIKSIKSPDRRIEADKLAFTPDGRYFAALLHDKLVVVDVTKGRQVAQMASPVSKPAPGQRFNPTDAIFVYAWTRAIAFSPDGKELAAFTTHPQPRLLCWSAKGKLVMDQPAPLPRSVGADNSLHWLPDGSGWLVNGYLIDRATKRVVLSVRAPFASNVQPRVMDKDRLLAVLASDETSLQSIGVPWDRLKASLKEMTAKGPAFVSPFQPLSLEVDVTGARGDIEETRKALTDALTARLAREGIAISPNQETVLRLALSEEAGETLPIFERQSAFDFQGRETGRTATEAKGAAILELGARGAGEPLWRSFLTAGSSRSFSEEINDVSVRKSMLEHLTSQLNGMDIPYFIPESADLVALPAVVE